MENIQFFVFLLALIALWPMAAAQLRPNHYANVCPNLENIVRGAVQKSMAQSPISAPATLRLFFHDCAVRVKLVSTSDRPLNLMICG